MHPLDGVLAFFGALGFIGALVAIPVSFAFEYTGNDIDQRYNARHVRRYPVTQQAIHQARDHLFGYNARHVRRYPVTVTLVCVTVALLLLVLVFGVVNMYL